MEIAHNSIDRQVCLCIRTPPPFFFALVNMTAIATSCFPQDRSATKGKERTLLLAEACLNPGRAQIEDTALERPTASPCTLAAFQQHKPPRGKVARRKIAGWPFSAARLQPLGFGAPSRTFQALRAAV